MKTQTYMVQVQVADQFEDLYVQARSEREAIAKARKLTKLDARWASFTV